MMRYPCLIAPGVGVAVAGVDVGVAAGAGVGVDVEVGVAVGVGPHVQTAPLCDPSHRQFSGVGVGTEVGGNGVGVDSHTRTVAPLPDRLNSPHTNVGVGVGSADCVGVGVATRDDVGVGVGLASADARAVVVGVTVGVVPGTTPLVPVCPIGGVGVFTTPCGVVAPTPSAPSPVAPVGGASLPHQAEIAAIISNPTNTAAPTTHQFMNHRFRVPVGPVAMITLLFALPLSNIFYH